jgi:type II secretory pathway predicted ATPase ExeA
MYYEYWQLQKPPFDNVPDPSMYAECHTSMENAIAETLFAIEEGNECLAVIVGDVGLGKTLSLRIIIDSLSPEKYQVALITNPSISFVQLLNEVIGQLTESPCNEKRKVALLEIFNKLLFQKADAGKKIVLLIDEGNAITPANLESLRLLTNMQDDRRNLFTMVLAGQIELARRLEDPKRANFFQRIGTYSRIEKIAPDQLRDYVETRLRLAGATRPIFTEDTYPVFWKYSEQGVPRLINKIAKLSLKAGETYGLEQVDASVVYQVSRQFEKITAVKTAGGRTRKKKEESFYPETVETPLSFAAADPGPENRVEMEDPPRDPEGRAFSTGPTEPFGTVPVIETERQPDPEPVLAEEAAVPVMEESATTAGEEAGAVLALAAGSSPAADEGVNLSRTWGEEGKPVSLLQAEAEKEDPVSDAAPDTEEIINEEEKAAAAPPEALEAEEPVNGTPAFGEVSEEIEVGSFKIQLHLPAQFLSQALSAGPEARLQMAGLAAAQAIKNNTQLSTSPAVDPFSVWSDLRTQILKRLDVPEPGMAA